MINNYLQLFRIRIAMLAAFAAACAFVLSMPPERWKIVFVIVGVFLLACGASCLNQYQERTTDALMARTKNRPLPSGMIAPLHAFIFSLLLAGAGIVILYAQCGFRASVLGLFAAAWYNGVYTYLKRISPFAAVPGAITGALPPAVGWAAGGGNLLDPRLLALCLFFMIWQVPHFWLFLMNHSEEYSKAGLPSITDIFRRHQFARIIFHWIAATAVCGLALSLFGFAQSALIIFPLLAASVWLVCQGIKFLRNKGDSCRAVFSRINIYMVVVMLLLISDNFLASHCIREYYAAITAALL